MTTMVLPTTLVIYKVVEANIGLLTSLELCPTATRISVLYTPLKEYVCKISSFQPKDHGYQEMVKSTYFYKPRLPSPGRWHTRTRQAEDCQRHLHIGQGCLTFTAGGENSRQKRNERGGDKSVPQEAERDKSSGMLSHRPSPIQRQASNTSPQGMAINIYNQSK